MIWLEVEYSEKKIGLHINFLFFLAYINALNKLCCIKTHEIPKHVKFACMV